jgi:predicted ATP-grasp superfamily ATP-dependent carboligase
MKVFVTDGDERPALAITRSLGRRGIHVLVGEQGPGSLASSSRYCARHVTYPSPHREREAFQRFLVDFVQREGVDVVVPVTDVTTWSVCLVQEALRRHTAIAVPSFEAFERATDKTTLLHSAVRCGIRIPRTHFVDGIAGLHSVADRVEYPAVVKPARSRILTRRGWEAAGVHYVASEADLWRLYAHTEHLAVHPSLIQQRIVGPGLGLFALFDRGRLLTTFAHRRLREKPPSGGVSVLSESVPVDSRLEDEARRLLGPLGWHGVAMLEYKQDAATGSRFLIEANGRFWGSLQLAVDAGVDFPYLACELALGRRPDESATYRVGVMNRWLLGDLDHLLLRLFHGHRDRSLLGPQASRLRVLVDFLKVTRPGVGDQVARADDPRPFLYELGRYVKSSGASFARRAAGAWPWRGSAPLRFAGVRPELNK